MYFVDQCGVMYQSLVVLYGKYNYQAREWTSVPYSVKVVMSTCETRTPLIEFSTRFSEVCGNMQNKKKNWYQMRRHVVE